MDVNFVPDHLPLFSRPPATLVTTSSHPAWRRSNTTHNLHPLSAGSDSGNNNHSSGESTYGFHSGGGRVYPASCHYLSSLLTPAPPAHPGLTLPQYVWDPPPPYSHPQPRAAQPAQEEAETQRESEGSRRAGSARSPRRIVTSSSTAELAGNSNCASGSPASQGASRRSNSLNSVMHSSECGCFR